jgi:hypothetical protein
MVAAQNNSTEVAKLLMLYELNQAEGENDTNALQAALKSDSFECAKLLADEADHSSAHYETPLMTATQKGRWDILKLLVPH